MESDITTLGSFMDKRYNEFLRLRYKPEDNFNLKI